MSKVQLLWLALVGILLVSIGVYFVVGKKQILQPEEKQESSILLYRREGDVSYKTEGSSVFLKATTSPTIISNKTYVYTGLGVATIVFPDNSSIDLDKYTELEVRYEENNISIYQTLGTTYHRVQALLSGKSYEVSTPGAVAAIRGTKFAVKYDKKTKTTKVAVTEHSVAVSKVDANGSSTQPVMVGEDKMAKVDEYVPKNTPISVSDTSSDPQMKAWVDDNKTRDIEIDSFNKDEFRSRINTILLEETKKTDTSTPDDKATSEEKRETTDKKKTTDVVTPAKDIRVPVTSEPETEQTTAPDVIKKLDEETFFTQFDNLFSDYFYLDDSDTPCTFNVYPSDRVKKVTSFASASGWPFTSPTLLSFAQAIDSYCKNKTPDTKTKLQQRFDDEFPFKDE